jgi:phospholipid/cholesterol/gamma-HCH transport system ATP-binding protein
MTDQRDDGVNDDATSPRSRRPDRGQIWVDGEDIVGMRERNLYRVRQKFGVLFQDGALFGSMSLFDNIAFPLREHTSKNEKEIATIVHRNAEMVGLLDHLRKLPGEVSGGMKNRAGLARAMVMDPEIVLFDEPDSGFDPVRVAYLDELVVNAQRETGATFFIITHNIESVTRVADYIGVLFRSRLVQLAPKDEMLHSDDPVISQFLTGSADGTIGMDEMAENDDHPRRAGANGRTDGPPATPLSRPTGGQRSAPAGSEPGTTINGAGPRHRRRAPAWPRPSTRAATAGGLRRPPTGRPATCRASFADGGTEGGPSLVAGELRRGGV